MPIREVVDVDFGLDEMTALDKFVDSNLTALKNSFQDLHENKVPEWRRLYKGIPKEEKRSFPWPNASNVVIQLIGENVDTLKARILGSIYEILPLWTAALVGEWPAEAKGEEQRKAVEQFMNLMAMEPGELDLYRVESLAVNDMIQYGTVVVKNPWETDVEQLVVSPLSTGRGAPNTTPFVKYDGPRPEKLAIEDWAATPTSTTIEKAPFKYHRYTLTKQKIQEKIYNGAFKREAGEKVLKSPDRSGVSTTEEKRLRDQNIQIAPSDVSQWDFYECWFHYWHNDKKYMIIYTYHLGSKTKMRAIFNFYPDNEEPFELGRLGYTDDGLMGYGFAEMLKYYQEEVTTGHNQRVDNRTLMNTSIALIGKNSKLDAGFSLYPMATLPISPEEFEVQQLGSQAPSSVEEEMMTIGLAKARAGVDDPTGGSGSGVTNPKKGGYSAMGTFAIMQQGNRRVNINVTDFRYLHLKLGRKTLKQYAEFGIGKRQDILGLQAKILLQALQSIKNGKLSLPIRAATAAVNQEVEKQNGMLFTQVMQRHQGMIAQLAQGIENPQMPEVMKDYLIGVIEANGQLMSKLLLSFGFDDIARLQPELKLAEYLRAQEKAKQQQEQQQQQQRSRSLPANGQSNIQGTSTQDAQNGEVQALPQTDGSQRPM